MRVGPEGPLTLTVPQTHHAMPRGALLHLYPGVATP